MECEGDCDTNSDCAGDLQCFQRDADSDVVPGCATTGYVTTRSPHDYCYKSGSGSDTSGSGSGSGSGATKGDTSGDTSGGDQSGSPTTDDTTTGYTAADCYIPDTPSACMRRSDCITSDDYCECYVPECCPNSCDSSSSAV